MSKQKEPTPCADCKYCIPIGEGDGLCDFSDETYGKFIVELFDVYPDCPKKEGGRR